MKSDNIYSLIGYNLGRIRRTVLDISQEKMAEELHLSRSFLSKLESRKVNQSISIDLLDYISRFYGFNIKDFFEGYEVEASEDESTLETVE